MIHASFIQIERDNLGAQSPGKHNYIITDYNDLLRKLSWPDEIKTKNPDKENCGGNIRYIRSVANKFAKKDEKEEI